MYCIFFNSYLSKISTFSDGDQEDSGVGYQLQQLQPDPGKIGLHKSVGSPSRIRSDSFQRQVLH